VFANAEGQGLVGLGVDGSGIGSAMLPEVDPLLTAGVDPLPDGGG
jgi:hypothetical protein